MKIVIALVIGVFIGLIVEALAVVSGKDKRDA